MKKYTVDGSITIYATSEVTAKSTKDAEKKVEKLFIEHIVSKNNKVKVIDKFEPELQVVIGNGKQYVY